MNDPDEAQQWREMAEHLVEAHGAHSGGLIGVIELVLGPDEGELDRDSQPLPGLDQVLATAGVAGAGLVGLRRRP